MQTQIPNLLSPRQTEALTSMSAATIWRLRQTGKFPAPLKISARRVAYRRTDIEAWIESRAAEGQAHAA